MGRRKTIFRQLSNQTDTSTNTEAKTRQSRIKKEHSLGIPDLSAKQLPENFLRLHWGWSVYALLHSARCWEHMSCKNKQMDQLKFHLSREIYLTLYSQHGAQTNLRQCHYQTHHRRPGSTEKRLQVSRKNGHAGLKIKNWATQIKNIWINKCVNLSPV